MNPHTANSTLSVTGAEAPASPDSGLVADVRILCRELANLAQEHVQLAALETRLAGQSLTVMVAASIMVGMLLVSAWFGLVAAAIAVMIHLSVPIHIAILVSVLANVLIAVLLCVLIRQQSRHLRWEATMRSLRHAAAPNPHGGAAI